MDILAIKKRLLELQNDVEAEEYHGTICVESLCNFYYFLQKHPTLKNPSISLTPANNIYATWKDTPDQLFSVHFMPNGDARFVVSRSKNKMLTGQATVDNLLNICKNINWIYEGNP